MSLVSTIQCDQGGCPEWTMDTLAQAKREGWSHNKAGEDFCPKHTRVKGVQAATSRVRTRTNIDFDKLRHA